MAGLDFIPLYQLPKSLSDLLNFTVTPNPDPGSSLDSRLRGNDGETPITARLQDSLHRRAKRTSFLANAMFGRPIPFHFRYNFG
jgi:hypothetical protein